MARPTPDDNPEDVARAAAAQAAAYAALAKAAAGMATMRDAFVDAGFTRPEAIQLVGEVLREQIRKGGSK